LKLVGNIGGVVLESWAKVKPSQLLQGISIKIFGENMKSFIVSMIATAGLVMAGSVMAEDMPELAKKSGCTACHAVDKKVVGPAWADVGKAYNSNGATTTGKKVSEILSENGAKTPKEWLLKKVAAGGTGNWGTAKMTPNSPKVSDADIATLVDFVLSHK
jgi:cytochrome c551/c552